MSKVIGPVELQIAEALKTTIQREAQRLLEKGDLEGPDFIKLEKITKAYTTLMAYPGETLKAGLFDHFTDTQLEELTGQGKQLVGGKKRGRRGRKPAGHNEDKLQSFNGDDEVGDE